MRKCECNYGAGELVDRVSANGISYQVCVICGRDWWPETVEAHKACDEGWDAFERVRRELEMAFSDVRF